MSSNLQSVAELQSLEFLFLFCLLFCCVGTLTKTGVNTNEKN